MRIHLEFGAAAAVGSPPAGAFDVALELSGYTVLLAADVDVETGRFTAIMGPSGSGKSTTAAALPRSIDATRLPST